MDVLATCISVDRVRVLVTIGELGRYKKVHETVSPKFDKECTEASVIEEEEVLTLRPEERGTQQLFVSTDKFPKG